ncbi:glutamine synthetase/guanido kinase [Marasmius fiardii PR-910]|nr:glutamine synthetase/guanido kinase [Marasmius fiardii PR-910]
MNTQQIFSDFPVLSYARYVRLQYVDAINIVRYRVFPIKSFLSLLAKDQPKIVVGKAILGLAFLNIADGFTACGEYYLVPDLASLRVLSYKPGHVSCMGVFEENSKGQTPEPVDICPRSVLNKAVARAKEVGVEFRVGFEIEFVLLTSTSPVVAVQRLEHYMSSLALPAGSLAEKVLEEIVESLEASGIEVLMYHAESAPGQYEIVTGHLEPLEAADALVHTRETIYGVANQHGLRATLAPNVYANSSGTGAHVHISVHSTANSINSSPPTKSDHSDAIISDNLTNLEESFLSGLMDEFPALTALTLPFPASYDRVADGKWTGGTYVCWGFENREVPIRLCNRTDPASRNFEIKTIDGTANPYLSLSGVITAGTAGVRSARKLQVKPCLDAAASEKGELGRGELGVTSRIPSTWNESRAHLKQNAVFREAFGTEMINKYLNHNKIMAEALGRPLSEDGRRSLLVEMY